MRCAWRIAACSWVGLCVECGVYLVRCWARATVTWSEYAREGGRECEGEREGGREREGGSEKEMSTASHSRIKENCS